MGVRDPEIAAVLARLAEFGGGLALVLGLATRPAGVAAAGTMAVAANKVHWPPRLRVVVFRHLIAEA